MVQTDLQIPNTNSLFPKPNRIAIVECEFMQPGYRPGEGYFEDIAEFIVLATKILYSRVSWN